MLREVCDGGGVRGCPLPPMQRALDAQEVGTEKVTARSLPFHGGAPIRATALHYAQDSGDEVRANKTPLPPSPGDAHLLLHVMLMCFVHALSSRMLHCLALPIPSHA